MKAKPNPILLSNSTTKERYEALREEFPNHRVVGREQLGYFIHDVRFGNGGKSWQEVADTLNSNQVIHSQWRREDPDWDAALVCQFAHRLGIVNKHIWRQSSEQQTTLDLDDNSQSLQVLQGNTEPPQTAVNVTFKAEGADFEISGEYVREPNTPLRIRFEYEGVPDPHFLQFLHERGLPTTASN